MLLFLALLVYGSRHRSFDWGVWILLGSFACNWLGHYVTLGIYPFVSGLIEAHTWNVAMGIAAGCLVFVLSLVYLLSHSSSRKGRMLAALLTFIALGIVSLSTLDG